MRCMCSESQQSSRHHFWWKPFQHSYIELPAPLPDKPPPFPSVAGDFPLSSSQDQPSPTHLLRFDLNLSSKYIVSSVELRLWYHIIDRDSVQLQDKQRITISHIVKREDDTYHGEDPTFYCTRASVSLKQDGYVSFNITNAIKQWMDVAESGVGRFYLEVRVEKLQSMDESGQLVFPPPAVKVAYTDREGSYSKTTQLVLRVYSADDKRRGRRQVGGRVDPSCSAARTRNCCKRNLVLDIHRDLRWSWVLRPRILPVNFCSGLCSLNWPTATYNTLLTLVYSSQQGNPTGSPTPCCVPDKFASIPFLIFNGTIIELVSIDDISIASCICR